MRPALRRRAVALAVAIGALTAVGVDATSAHPAVAPTRWALPRVALDPALHPGAAALTGAPVPDGVAPKPAYGRALTDKRANEGCAITSSSPPETPLVRCDFGPSTAPLRIAAIGNSHMGHWRAALNRLARHLPIRVTTYIRNACPFTDRAPAPTDEATCAVWSAAVLDALAADPPDAVLLTSTTSLLGRSEMTTDGMVGTWRRIAELGVPVIGIRDTPRLGVDMPLCAAEHGPGSRRCRISTEGILAPVAPVLETDLAGIDYHHIDMNRWVCPRAVCRPVIGNVTVWRDGHHLTDTYARTLAPLLARQLGRVLNDI